MKFPRKVYWRGKTWRVRARKRYRDDRVAEINYDTKIISYKIGLPREERIASLLHEFSHLVAPKMSHDQIEPLCVKLAKLFIENEL